MNHPTRASRQLYPIRLMVFLDDQRAAALEERAREQRVSKARLIRDLLDQGIREWEAKQAA